MAGVDVLEEEDTTYVSASKVQLDDQTRAPRPLCIDGEPAEWIDQNGDEHVLIPCEVVKDYVQSHSNAVRRACCGIQVHRANGYLINQFMQSTSNKRSDEYGGSVENRCRFALGTGRPVIK